VLVNSSPFAEGAVLEKGFPGVGLLSYVDVVVFVVPQALGEGDVLF